MTEQVDKWSLAPIKQRIGAMIARSSEIVGRCEEHGDFTRGNLAEHGLRGNSCPQCFIDKESEFQREQRLLDAAHFFKTASGVPPRFQDSSFEKYMPVSDQSRMVFDAIRDYAKNFEQHQDLGVSLVFCGGPGTGKTHLACAVLHYLAHALGITGKFCTAYRVVQEVRESYRSRELSEIKAMDAFIQPKLLVMDEIGVQYGTDSEHLILFNILNGRYEAMRPTIVISNLNVDGVRRYLDDRVYDRLRENGGGVFSFGWGSWRQMSGKT